MLSKLVDKLNSIDIIFIIYMFMLTLVSCWTSNSALFATSGGTAAMLYFLYKIMS